MSSAGCVPTLLLSLSLPFPPTLSLSLLSLNLYFPLSLSQTQAHTHIYTTHWSGPSFYNTEIIFMFAINIRFLFSCASSLGLVATKNLGFLRFLFVFFFFSFSPPPLFSSHFVPYTTPYRSFFLLPFLFFFFPNTPPLLLRCSLLPSSLFLFLSHSLCSSSYSPSCQFLLLLSSALSPPLVFPSSSPP